MYDEYDDQYSTEVQGIDLINGGSGYSIAPKVYIGSTEAQTWRPNTIYEGLELLSIDGRYYIVDVGGISGDQSIGISFREYLQERRAESLIAEATGIPDEQFAGWDPRIDTKAIKLRTLQLSKEDVREYGFWKSDEEELRRNLAILEEDQVTTQMSSIVRTRARRDFDISHTVKSEMIKRGIEVSNIQVSNVGYGDSVINIS